MTWIICFKLTATEIVGYQSSKLLQSNSNLSHNSLIFEISILLRFKYVK